MSIPISLADELSQTLNSSSLSLRIDSSNGFEQETDLEQTIEGAFEISPRFSDYYDSSTEESKK